MWLLYYFNFESNVLKSKSLYMLLNKNINFNKNEVEAKMENPTHSFRETNLVFFLNVVSSYIYFTVYFSQKMVKISFTYF